MAPEPIWPQALDLAAGVAHDLSIDADVLSPKFADQLHEQDSTIESSW
jgi:hypothetical protein